jgi:hypothetical protein
MPQTNLQVLTFAFQNAGIVDETRAPSNVQAANGLVIMNAYLLTQARDGMRLGYYPQTNLANICPLQDSDINDVKMMMVKQLSMAYGTTIKDQDVRDEIEKSERRLTKRTQRYFESDLGELSRAQGGPWGGPNWG